jgi:drug/metabolite transporter (DMT)-like permease
MLFIGEFAALTAAVLWSNSSIIFTTASIKLGSMQLNVDRMAMAVLYLIITIFVFKIDFTLNFNQILLLSISGFVGLIIGDTALFKSFAEIGPRLTLLIYSCNPAIAGVLAFIVLHETLSKMGIVGIFVTLSGIALVVLDKTVPSDARFKITTKGVLFAFLGSAGQGVGLIFAKMAFSYGDMHSFTATFVRIFSSLILMFIISLIFKKYRNPIKIYSKDKKLMLIVILGSIIGPFLGITLSFVALTHTKVGIASTLMSTVPVLVLPLTHYFYKEKISFKAIIGAFITVGGVAMLFLT